MVLVWLWRDSTVPPGPVVVWNASEKGTFRIREPSARRSWRFRPVAPVVVPIPSSKLVVLGVPHVRRRANRSLVSQVVLLLSSPIAPPL
jgi:hypothetical protein